MTLREERLIVGEEKLRQLARMRGLIWETMTDEERIYFVDDLIHEDRGRLQGNDHHG